MTVDLEAGAAAVRTEGLRRRLGSRIGWNICDQALSSLTNAALSILVARAVSENAFGAFALCFTIYAVVVGVSRGLVSEPLTIRYGDASPGTFDAARRGAAGSALAAGLVVGLLLFGFAQTQSEALREPLLALALCMPGLLLQDAIRFSFITEGKPRRAAANDFVWAVLQFAAVVWLLYADTSSAGPFVLAWGGAAVGAALYGVAQTRTLPALGSALRWIRAQIHLSGFFVAEYLTVLGSVQVAFLIVGAIAGIDAVGALRGATVVLGPLNILTFGAFAFSVPELVRRRGLPLKRHVQLAGLISGTLVFAVAVWSALMLLLPTSAGVELLGDTWHGARSVLAPMALLIAGTAACLGPLCSLRAFGAARESFFVGVLVATLLLALGTMGVALDGARGAAVGFAIAQWTAVPVIWTVMIKVVRSRTTNARSEGAST
jgi:O-antigen/teichoic acid export membrane protein